MRLGLNVILRVGGGQETERSCFNLTGPPLVAVSHILTQENQINLLMRYEMSLSMYFMEQAHDNRAGREIIE